MFSKFFSRKIVLSVLAVLLLAGVAAYASWYFFYQNYRFSGTEKLTAEISSVEAPGDSSVTADKIMPKPLRVYFSYPAARMDLNGKPVENGINIYPGIRGAWRFENDSLLSFMPETDWIPGTEYKVEMSEDIFNPDVKLDKRSFKFSSPKFQGSAVSSEFYEDPADFRIKKAVAAFRFNYPLDVQNLEDKISVRTVGGDTYGFTYKLSDLNTVLHVLSAPVKIKDKEDFAVISVNYPQNAYNHKALDDKLSARVTIPGGATYFKIKSVSTSIVRNEQKNDNPEQILFVDFSTSVKSKELDSALKVWYVNDYCSNIQSKLGRVKGNDLSVLGKLKELPLSEVSTASDSLKNHMFKYDLNARKACLVVRVQKGLSSVEGFRLNADSLTLVNPAEYPLEAKIAAEGSLLSLKGSREVPFVSRGVKELKATVARIDAGNLNNLVTQTYGDFSHPYFRNYSFNEDNISEIFEKTLPVNMQNPAEANYSSLDLNGYFQNRKGVFLIKLRGYADKNNFSSEDSRLVVLTDLGIVVKDNLDKTHNLFVADISSGKPVENARVEVLGKNGIPVLSLKTNAEGMVLVPDFSGFKNDKEAVVYKVSLGDDVSFIPVSRSDRRLDFSRFDVGGEYDYNTGEEQLKGYVFTDRGIYRPGEKAHFGLIVRQADMRVPAHLPFTVEARNPNGDIIASGKLRSGEDGYMEYSLNLNRTAVTGLYSLSLYVDGKDGRRYVSGTDFRVEEFAPDTMRIKAVWDGYAGKGWFTGKDLPVSVSLHNLYGNPAADHELKASYRLTPADFCFKDYAGYLFRDPLRNTDKILRSYNDKLPDRKTDASGEGLLNIDLSAFETGTYNLNLQIEGFELGSGRGVKTSLNALVSPNEYLIGWKADGDLSFINKDSEHKVRFIAVDNKLAQIGKTGLFLSLSKRSYASSLVEMPNGTYRYQMVPKETLISKSPWRIEASGTEEKLNTAEPGEFILSVEDEKENLLAKIEYNVAGAGNLVHAVDKDAGLGLKLAKNEYNSGEKIAMQITAPYKGYGLITIERDSVYAYKWFKAEEASSMQEIELPEGVEGNAYVNVAFFRDIDSKEIFMPSMTYAAAPFAIDTSARRVDIALNVPESVKPGEELKIGYKTSHPSRIIVYGVNQGILQVAGYKLPQPLQEFFKKKALRVVTSQIMDLIMPDIRILRMLSSSGGDAGFAADALAKNLNPFARKQDKPVAFWSGIIPAGEEEQVYAYKVPETFNGEIKVMAVAVSDERFGSAEKSVLSRGDFALTPSGPFNVSPGDEFVIGVGIGNLVENSGADYPVAVSIENSGGFVVIGDKSQTVNLAENGEALVKFRLKAPQKLGAREIVFKAQAVNDSPRSAQMPYNMSIRAASPYLNDFEFGWAKASLTLQDVAIGLYPEFRVQEVSASASPMLLAQGLIRFIDKFPHFCTEQTVSKTFPAMEVFFKYPDLLKGIDVYALYDDALAKLRERQTLNGGFSTWTVYGAVPNEFDSVYAAHFLVKAKEHNFNVPENMLAKALDYSASVAGRKPAGLADINPAYAAYVLTLSGQVTTNYLIALEEYYQNNYPREWKKSLNASLMAASYKLLQNEAKARSLSGQYRFGGEDPANDAAAVYLQASYFPEDFKTSSAKDVKQLLRPLETGNFNTISSAFSILALNAFDASEADKQIRFSAGEVSDTPFPTVPFSPVVKELKMTSDNPFFYAVRQQGFALELPQKAAAEGIEVSKEYLDKDGKAVTSAALGEELTVKIRYRSLQKNSISDVALVDLLPGCFEAVSGSVNGGWSVASSEIREDRVVAYVTAEENTAELTYRVKVVAEGNFVLPPLSAEALYQPLVRANTAAARIDVR